MEISEALLSESFKLQVEKYMGKLAVKDNRIPVLKG